MELYAIKSWYDQNRGVITLEDDVLGVVQEIKRISDGRVRVYYNAQSDAYDLVELCLDHTERLVFSTKELDQRVLIRFQEADQWGGDTPDRGMQKPEGEDFADEADALNEAMFEARDEASRDKLGDVGERLAWALDIAGVGVQDSILVKKDING